MPRVKVTHDYQVTIPADIRTKEKISEGDYLEIYIDNDGHIIMKKVKGGRRTLRSSRKLTVEEIEEIIGRGREGSL